MKNNYFQFKQFIVHQDRCALKVTTDACLFGAWIAEKVAGVTHHRPQHVLDIGAGSSLLMLMLAQRFEGRIDGIEIDQASYEQSIENIQLSPWRDRLQLFHHDVKLFALPHQYDLIISNPPFFENDLKSGLETRNISKHDTALTLADLLEVSDRNLSPHGKLAVLLPYSRLEYFEQLAGSLGLFVRERMLVRQTANHPFFRGMLLLERNFSGQPLVQEIVIKPGGSDYSPEFVALLKDYYLYL